MIVVLCNCSPAEADALASTLVDRRLAACVNVIPGVTSVYRWEGAVRRDTEATLLIKSTPDRANDLAAAIRELHSYDTPEFVVLRADEAASDPRYVAWVREEVSA